MKYSHSKGNLTNTCEKHWVMAGFNLSMEKLYIFFRFPLNQIIFRQGNSNWIIPFQNILFTEEGKIHPNWAKSSILDTKFKWRISAFSILHVNLFLSREYQETMKERRKPPFLNLLSRFTIFTIFKGKLNVCLNSPLTCIFTL